MQPCGDVQARAKRRSGGAGRVPVPPDGVFSGILSGGWYPFGNYTGLLGRGSAYKGFFHDKFSR